MIQEKTLEEQLREEIERQKAHIKKLQADVGKWKRMAREQKPKPEFIREQHDERGRHIIEIHLNGIPGDVGYLEALEHLKYEVLPHYYPYYYVACYQSQKYDGWIARLAKVDIIDMSYIPANQGGNSKEILNKFYWDLYEQLKRYNHYFSSVENITKEDIAKVEGLVFLINRMMEKMLETEF
ncbi:MULTISPECIES: hypothetical protein [Bacillaceae]|uniref:hypothetical protein n=1 Tax=Bacillaceae TaxID=186817 RepID=UPI000E2EC757|nr:hypothetical protein [Bacillus sp. HNG]RFB09457.1 hypothetical protein DZB84_24260 [Bacillus sp. HNG]